MTEDLVKRLRDADAYNSKHYVRDPLHSEAAKRIEALEAELAAALKRGSAVGELQAKLKAQEMTNEDLRIALRNAGQSQSSDTLNIALRRWLENSRDGSSDGLQYAR